MEDDKQEPTHSSRGNEWEVVSLTASTYAAAPSPETNDSTNGNKDKELTKQELDCSQMLCKSDFEHLVFPPKEHEDLPVNSDSLEMSNNDPMVQKLEMDKHEVEHNKIPKQWVVPALSNSEVVDDIKFFDKGKMLSIQKIEFEERNLQGVGVLDSDYQGHSLSAYSSNHDIIDESTADQNINVLSTDSPLEQNLLSPSNVQENAEKHTYRGPLCEEWWKKQAASLHAHTTKTDIYWSIFVAASIVGLILIGKKWRQEIWRIR